MNFNRTWLLQMTEKKLGSLGSLQVGKDTMLVSDKEEPKNFKNLQVEPLFKQHTISMN